MAKSEATMMNKVLARERKLAGRVHGVRVGGKKVTKYSQVKPKHPSKLSTKDRIHTGVGIAIL